MATMLATRMLRVTCPLAPLTAATASKGHYFFLAVIVFASAEGRSGALKVNCWQVSVAVGQKQLADQRPESCQFRRVQPKRFSPSPPPPIPYKTTPKGALHIYR